ncbi:dihydroorotate dehydrogenase, partial [Candidatus Bipolaricaulota bacterium]|nr:dihydroorotate dehydrogenase [Candidatus Bipolaricaulota bacterium]
MKSDNLALEVAGMHLENPLMLASGVMGTTPGGLKRVALEGAGGVVTKSLGPTPREGHRSPNVVKVESGYLNAMGLPNPGVEEFASEMEGEEIGTTVLGSIYGSTPEEFLEVA